MSHICEQSYKMYLLVLLAVLSSATAQGNDGRIIGGSNAVLGQNPYQVSMQTASYQHFCGGSIINNRWIITAAHCIGDGRPKYLMVGSVTLNPAGTRYEVATSVKHQFYFSGLSFFDIALVKTKIDIVFGPNVQPIALATKELPDGAMLTASGWGTITHPNITIPNALQTLDTPKLNIGECRANWTSLSFLAFVTDDMMCVRKVVGQGLCFGDSGGPLIYNNTLYGVVSFGYPCAKGYPDVLTKVSSYGWWISTMQFLFGWA